MTTAVHPRQRAGSARWMVPVGLILLSLIPVLSGLYRLSELGGAVEIRPDSERFIDSPIPVVIHIVSVTLFAVLGAFQFVPALRGRRGWHRIAGGVLVPAGILVALSAIWMNLYSDLPPTDGALLFVLRLIFGIAMLASILLGVRAIRRRDFAAHGAWMTRAYAIAMGAGTQAILLIVPELFAVSPDVLMRGVLSGIAWVLNLAVAELAIRRRAGAMPRPAVRS